MRTRKIQLRNDRLVAIAKERGWTKVNGTINARAFAQSIGINHSTVTRYLNGDAPLAARFVAQVLATTGLPFEELFQVVEDDESELVAS